MFFYKLKSKFMWPSLQYIFTLSVGFWCMDSAVDKYIQNDIIFCTSVTFLGTFFTILILVFLPSNLTRDLKDVYWARTVCHIPLKCWCSYSNSSSVAGRKNMLEGCEKGYLKKKSQPYLSKLSPSIQPKWSMGCVQKNKASTSLFLFKLFMMSFQQKRSNDACFPSHFRRNKPRRTAHIFFYFLWKYKMPFFRYKILYSL